MINVGFTPNFLQILEECWHILPYGKGVIREKDPLMAVETNDELLSIQSPISGVLMNFSEKAMNFPDKLTSDDVIVSLNPDTKYKPEVVTVAPRRPILGGFDPAAPIDWAAIDEAHEAERFEETNRRIRVEREALAARLRAEREVVARTTIQPIDEVLRQGDTRQARPGAVRPAPGFFQQADRNWGINAPAAPARNNNNTPRRGR